MLIKYSNRLLLVAFSALTSLAAFANEGGAHEASPADTIFPFINVTILFAILHFTARKPIAAMMVARAEKIQSTKAAFEEKKRHLEDEFSKLEQDEKGFDQLKEVRLREVQKAAELEKEKQEKDTKAQAERAIQEAVGRLESFKAEQLKSLVSSFLFEKQGAIEAKVKSDFTAEREVKYVEQYIKELN